LAGGVTYYLSIVQNTVNFSNWFWVLANTSGSDSVRARRTSDAAAWTSNLFDTSKMAFELLGVAGADVSVDIAATPDPVKRGQSLTYVMHVTNHGALTSKFVILEDVLPADVTFQSVTTLGTAITPSVGSTGTVWIDLGDVAPGATAQVTLVVKVNARGGSSISNTVSISSNTDDPVASNDTATINTGIFGSRK
jgi:uncharacterized repeat protein (TIGR01451 family)